MSNNRLSYEEDLEVARIWGLNYKACERFFLDYAQHSDYIRTLCQLLNIKLPHQKTPPFSWWTAPFRWLSARGNSSSPKVSLVPYIRRLVCTGIDSERNLEFFFGDCWLSGIGVIRKYERRNYLLMSKSANWDRVKSAYDIGSQETVLFLAPLREPTEEELAFADGSWSEWLAMRDWMPRSESPLSLDSWETRES
jgi:hypothetical protein